MPIILVAVLGTMNALLADEDGPDLENSIAIALTAVFVLPALATGDPVKGQSSWWVTGPTYSLFLRIILASLYNISPEVEDGAGGAVLSTLNLGGNVSATSTAGNPQAAVTWIGVGFMWLSPVILLLYIFKRWRFVRRIMNRAMVEYLTSSTHCKKEERNKTVKRLIGCKDASFDQYEMDKHKTRLGAFPTQVENLRSIGDMLEARKLPQWEVETKVVKNVPKGRVPKMKAKAKTKTKKTHLPGSALAHL
jgi:hypothetical protein